MKIFLILILKGTFEQMHFLKEDTFQSLTKYAKLEYISKQTCLVLLLLKVYELQ